MFNVTSDNIFRIGYNTNTFALTHNPGQAVVLWGAYNGTGIRDAYTFPPTAGPSASPITQTSTVRTSFQTLTVLPSTGTSVSAGTNQVMASSQVAVASSVPTQSYARQGFPTLSAGAKTGIAIGSAAGTIVIVAWVWLYSRLRKRDLKSKTSDRLSEEFEPVIEPLPEEPQEINERERMIELDSAARHELDSAARHELETAARHELDSAARHELDSAAKYELDSAARHELEARERAKELDSTAIYELEARERARSFHSTSRQDQRGLQDEAPPFPLWWAEVVRRLMS